MDSPQRVRTLNQLKASHNEYLVSIAGDSSCIWFGRRLKKVTNGTRDLLRKECGSENSLKQIARLARIIFGLKEDMKRHRLRPYQFVEELQFINDHIITYLNRLWSSKYDNKCASYGEAGVALYLNVFVALTVGDSELVFQSKPSFLINPNTGSCMEIDVMLENYRVGFEFQGEHHYRDSSVIQKDREKLRIAKQNNHILIPVNIFQLNSIALQTLIANTMKDYLNIQELYSERRHSYNPAQLPNSRRLLQFCKVIQRLYLAKTIFAESLNWLDIEMASYIANVSTRSPISSSTQAPRQIPSTVELDLDEVYAGLKNITAARKVRKMMLE